MLKYLLNNRIQVLKARKELSFHNNWLNNVLVLKTPIFKNDKYEVTDE